MLIYDSELGSGASCICRLDLAEEIWRVPKETLLLGKNYLENTERSIEQLQHLGSLTITSWVAHLNESEYKAENDDVIIYKVTFW